MPNHTNTPRRTLWLLPKGQLNSSQPFFRLSPSRQPCGGEHLSLSAGEEYGRCRAVHQPPQVPPHTLGWQMDEATNKTEYSAAPRPRFKGPRGAVRGRRRRRADSREARCWAGPRGAASLSGGFAIGGSTAAAAAGAMALARAGGARQAPRSLPAAEWRRRVT